MKVVIDCNVLVSAARSRGVCGRVIIEAMRYHEVVLSEPIVEEYEAIARRLAHAPYRDGLLAIIGELEQVATMVEPTDASFGLADSDDEVYLATAMAGDAVLITGNSRHFTQARYGSVEVLSPRNFLDRTTGGAASEH